MDKQIHRGTLEMVAAMLISGTIGWFVLLSGLPVLEVVFWRCVFGALTLLVVCAMLGFLRPGLLSRYTATLAMVSGVAIVGNCCCCSRPIPAPRSPSAPRSTTCSRSCW